MQKGTLIAMSGGIDSGIAASLESEKWQKHKDYKLVGATMKTYDYKQSCSANKQIGCCNLDTIEDARSVATKLNIPYMVLDIRKEFKNQVVKNFISEYLAGRTPNPCIQCNHKFKLGESMYKFAETLGCHNIATGHYARIRKENNRYILYKGIDQKKDQSYALWTLSQKQLARTLFPLGNLTKETVRKIAKEKQFNFLTTKPESYEICFIPDNDYRRFLKKQVDGLENRVKGGDFILENGTVVGKHEGYPFYTVGQRKGLKLSLGYPVYVTEIQPQKNRVILGTLDQLSRNGMWVHKLNMIKYPHLTKPLDVIVKVRYNDKGTPAVIQQQNEKMKVFFGKGVHAIAPGQAAVFYEGDDIVGGGWIQSSFNQKHI